MCLVVKKYAKKKTAVEDIVVYKALRISPFNNKELSSIYYGRFIYKFNTLYKTKIEETFDIQFFDDISVDYYSKFDVNTLRSYGSGFHSAISLERLRNTFYSKYKCIIPKGSKYIVDRTGLVISDQIIIIEKI